jgi:hypothetical protein
VLVWWAFCAHYSPNLLRRWLNDMPSNSHLGTIGRPQHIVFDFWRVWDTGFGNQRAGNHCDTVQCLCSSNCTEHPGVPAESFVLAPLPKGNASRNELRKSGRRSLRTYCEASASRTF